MGTANKGVCVAVAYEDRVFREKLTVSQLVKIVPAFYGTRRFITALKIARHPSLFCAKLSHSTSFPQILSRSTFILSSNLLLGLPSVFFSSDFSTNIMYKCYMPRPSLSPDGTALHVSAGRPYRHSCHLAIGRLPAITQRVTK